MFFYHVEGFRRYEGTFEGKPYGGYFLYCTHQDKDVEGLKTVEIKVKDKHGYHPRVGDDITVIYGPRGLESVKAG